MITRKNFRGKINCDIEQIKLAAEKDKNIAASLKNEGKILSASMYIYNDQLFLYAEFLDASVTPMDLFPNISSNMYLWPEKDALTPWAYMYPIFWHTDANSEELSECNLSEWRNPETLKNRRGRIAYLYEDKLFSYTYWHKALTDEGLLKGDRYQFIALHENILFSYFEEPKEFVNIKRNENQESEVIKKWLAVDPESHFDHNMSGAENFLLLPVLLAV